MPAASRRSGLRPAARYLILGSVALVLLLGAPLGSLAAPPSPASVTIQAAPGPGGLSAWVLWDGSNISNANTKSSAFPVSFNSAVNVLFHWTSAGYSISDARLQMFYFGFALATRDVTQSTGTPSGSIPMNWTTGALQYVIEGTYLLTASLLAPNGTAEWSQSFWVDVQAPYFLLAALPIVLILIAVYELYGVATVGKQAALKRQRMGGTPAPAPGPGDTAANPPGSPPAGGAT